MESIIRDGGELPRATNTVYDIPTKERYSKIFENDFRSCSTKDCKNYCISQKNFCKPCIEVKTLREEISKLREVNNELSVRIFNLETQHNLTERPKSSHKIDGWKARPKKTESDHIELLIKDLYGTMEKSIEEMKVSLEEKFSEQIEKIIGKNECSAIESLETYSDGNCKDNLTAAKQTDDDMYQESYIEEKKSVASDKSSALEEETQRRCKNAIIYGLKEEELESEDQRSVLSLLQAIEVETTPIKAYRLGRREPNKHRPIKLILNEKKEKYEIFDKFKLKSRRYKNIYIREDYTCKEREEIKKYVDEAKKRNISETEMRWYVKGCPRSKLYLEKRKNSETK